ncbi:MAG: GDSL-type esterase/lipase family protein [Armatimonadota bacterium]
MISLLIILTCLTLTAVLAAPVGEVKLTDSGKGHQIATHEGRVFALAYDKNMGAFAKADAADSQKGGIVFTGSSSMVGWKTVAKDMAPMPAVNRGFGGSTSPQLWWYADKAVLARDPRLVVIYVGDNDLVNASVNAGNYMKYIRLFREKVWQHNPRTRLIFLSNKPSPSRWKFWDKFQEANRRLERMCSRDRRLSYVDISPTLLDTNGQPRPECFQKDMLHMKPELYKEWTRVVRPVVERVWAEIEAEG